MARIRTIKPEAFKSGTLAEVSIETERSFYGMLTQADDKGRLKGGPEQAAVLNGALWPLRQSHTVDDMENDLVEMVRVGLLHRYEVGGRAFMHLPTFLDHQKINRPSPSKYPACSCEANRPAESSAPALFGEGDESPGRHAPQRQQTRPSAGGVAAEGREAFTEVSVIAPGTGGSPAEQNFAATSAPSAPASTAFLVRNGASAQVNAAIPSLSLDVCEGSVSAHGPLAEDSAGERNGKGRERDQGGSTPASQAAGTNPGEDTGPDADTGNENACEEDDPMAKKQPTDPNQGGLFDVAEPEPVVEDKPKKRAQPTSWTDERKAQAHALVGPFFGDHGEGFPQSYGVVFGVVVAALKNGVKDEELQYALRALGKERKPVSGGTIAFALTRRPHAEETVLAAEYARQDASTYKHEL